MKTALLTSLLQQEVKILDAGDDPAYEQNIPPQGVAKWTLVEYSDGKRLWTPNHNFTFNTPKINDFSRADIKVREDTK